MSEPYLIKFANKKKAVKWDWPGLKETWLWLLADCTRNDGNDEHDQDNQDVDYEGSDDDDGDEDGEDDNADLSINKVLAASAVLPSPVSVQLIQIFKYRSQLDCLEKVMRLELVAMQWIGVF